MNKSNSNLILGGLLAVAVIAAVFFWNKSRNLGQENMTITTDIQTLTEVRDDLLSDLDELHTNFDNLKEEKDSVTMLLTKADATVQQQLAQISKMKKSAVTDAAVIKAEIDELRKMKKNLSELVARLEVENKQLTEANVRLVSEVETVTKKADNLSYQVDGLKQMNSGLESEMKKLMASGARASNFRVDIMKKGDKPTGSHRRVREFEVSFDLKSISANMMGMREVYLVITDSKGTPIKSMNPVKATIRPADGGQFEIIAQQSREIELMNDIRVNFKQPVEGKLDPGHYRASVYTPFGMLGAAQFSLR